MYSGSKVRLLCFCNRLFTNRSTSPGLGWTFGTSVWSAQHASEVAWFRSHPSLFALYFWGGAVLCPSVLSDGFVISGHDFYIALPSLSIFLPISTLPCAYLSVHTHSDSVGLMWGLRDCISSKFPGLWCLNPKASSCTWDPEWRGRFCSCGRLPLTIISSTSQLWLPIRTTRGSFKAFYSSDPTPGVSNLINLDRSLTFQRFFKLECVLWIVSLKSWKIWGSSYWSQVYLLTPQTTTL